MYKDIVGIVGGMGSFSTLYMFKEILDSLSAIEDNERPRIIIDNYCNIPNKISACLSVDEREPFLACLSASILNLIKSGCTKIIIACNITHAVLNDLYAIHPWFSEYIVDMLAILARKMKSDGVKKAYLFATPNAIQTQVFQRYLSDVELLYPDTSLDQAEIFALMKLGKNSGITKEMSERFFALAKKYDAAPIVLACTELSMIYANVQDDVTVVLYDPLHETVEYLLEILK